MLLCSLNRAVYGPLRPYPRMSERPANTYADRPKIEAPYLGPLAIVHHDPGQLF